MTTDNKDTKDCTVLYNVFVYGTLKNMHKSSHWAGAGHITFVAPAKTVNEYVLYDGSGFPMVVNETAVNTEAKAHVVGELHTIDAAVLSVLDSYEGHPGFFKREEVEVEVDGLGPIKAWLYFGPENAHIHRDPIMPTDGVASWPNRPEAL